MKILLLFFCLCTAVLAADPIKELKLTDGTVLKDAVVKSTTARGVKIEHKDGLGTYPLELLPPDLRKQYGGEVQAAQAEVDKAAYEREAEAAAAKAREAEAQGVEFKVTSVKEGNSFFRYYVTVTELTGRQCDGDIFVRYETPDRPAGVGAKERPIVIKASDAVTGSYDWFTGPPGRHGAAGVTRLQWVVKTKDGRRYEGTSPVPRETSGALAADVKMENK